MFCAKCGTQVRPDQIFCSKCGYRLADAQAPVAAPAPSPVAAAPLPGPSNPSVYPSRVAKHLNILAILWIIFSILRLLPGLAMLAFSHAHFPFVLFPVPGPMRSFLTPLLSTLGLIISGIGIAGVIAGWGLMTHQSWARTLTIVLACISLIHFPLGTALGVYSLWVLAAQGAEQEYGSMVVNN